GFARFESPTRVGAVETAAITATYHGRALRTSVRIEKPPPLDIENFYPTPQTVQGGAPVRVAVVLNDDAPRGGAAVQLASDSAKATFNGQPATTVKVAAGERQADVPLGTEPVSENTRVTLTARLTPTGQWHIPLFLTTGPAPTLPQLALANAAAELGVREAPPGSNRGPHVDRYLARAGLPPGKPWNGAFVYWCFDEAARASRRQNPLPKTGDAAQLSDDAWRRGLVLLPRDSARLQPGMVAVYRGA